MRHILYYFVIFLKNLTLFEILNFRKKWLTIQRNIKTNADVMILTKRIEHTFCYIEHIDLRRLLIYFFFLLGST